MWLNGIVMPFSHLSRTSSSLVMSFILWWLLLSRVIGEVVPWKTITPENSNPCKRGFSKRTRTLQKTIFSCYTTHTYIQIQFKFLVSYIYYISMSVFTHRVILYINMQQVFILQNLPTFDFYHHFQHANLKLKNYSLVTKLNRKCIYRIFHCFGKIKTGCNHLQV